MIFNSKYLLLLETAEDKSKLFFMIFVVSILEMPLFISNRLTFTAITMLNYLQTRPTNLKISLLRNITNICYNIQGYATKIKSRTLPFSN